MFEKWKEYTANDVLRQTDKNANRLLSSFARDYKKVFNRDICPSCKDFNQKFQEFLNHTKTMSQKKNNSGYVLKKMYENIPLAFGSNIYVNNQNLTDAYAKKLLKNHPRGEELFSAIPKPAISKKSE